MLPASRSRTTLLDFRIQSGKLFPCFTIRLRKEDSGSSPPTQFVNPRDRRKPRATARFRLRNPTPIEPALSSPVAARAWPLPDAGGLVLRVQSEEAVT